MMPRFTVSLFCIVLAFAAIAAKPKNVILFIGDGMSTPQRMTADEFARKTGHAALVLNRLPCQATTRTCSANSLVTDSAAAATAIACGEKTNNGALGVRPDGTPVYSCAVAAKEAGKKVGIVTTVTINHATPGGFYAHRKSRGEGYGIGLDLLASGFDYFAGGGLSGHNDQKNKLYKGDIYDLAKDAGYAFSKKDRAAFDALKPGCGKAWYVATDDCMPFSIDTGGWEGVPTLAEMTAKGIALLENDKGFFMMVEGGKIDYAGHANDAATNMRELLALDDAVRVAVDYQKRHPDTLVVVTGDHETGGMTMGFAGTGYAFYMDRLASQKCSAEKVKDFVRKNRPKTFDELRPFIEKNFGVTFDGDVKKDPMALTKDEKGELERAFAHDIEAARKGLKDDERYDAAAFFGAMLGVGASLALADFFVFVLHVNGATMPFVQTLLYSGCEALDLADVFTGSVILASSGAVMDLAMDIASACEEIVRHRPDVSRRELLGSGLRVGRSVVGTMTTTLLLAYSGGYLTLLMVFAAQGTHPLDFVNSTLVSAEIVKTLVGSFGLVLVAPFTAIVSAVLFTRRGCP